MRVLVAVAVRAIILTFSGTRLLASPIARKSFRNVSPLLEETRERFIKLLRERESESERVRGREGERERGREGERERGREGERERGRERERERESYHFFTQ